MHFIGSLFLDNDFSVRVNTLYVCNSDNIQNCSTFWFFMVLTIKLIMLHLSFCSFQIITLVCDQFNLLEGSCKIWY